MLQIYPSEYGLEKMKEENESGPSELRTSQQLNDDDDDGLLMFLCYLRKLLNMFACYVVKFSRIW